MNQILILAILTLWMNTAMGQLYKRDTVIFRTICKCDNSVYNDTLKCIDRYGRKQGYWEYYRDRIHINIIGKDTQNVQKITEPIMKGFYTDDIKTNKWEYYNLSNLDYFEEILSPPKYSIIYFSDSSFEVEKYFGNYRIRYSKDSTIITGRVIRLIPKTRSSTNDTIPIIDSYEISIDSRIIDNKEKIRLLYKNNVIKEFDKNELDYELSALSIGIYDREIISYAR